MCEIDTVLPLLPQLIVYSFEEYHSVRINQHVGKLKTKFLKNLRKILHLIRRVKHFSFNGVLRDFNQSF